MPASLRNFVGRFLLIALIFNALTPLIAAARDSAGKGSILTFCTASGLKQIEVSLDGKALPTPAQHKNSCPFCLLFNGHAAMPATPLALAPLQIAVQAPAAVDVPALPPKTPRLTAAPRGPPASV